MTAILALSLLLPVTFADVTPGPSLLNSSTTLKLARRYVGYDFFNSFDFFTGNDPTNGYVNAANEFGLVSVGADGSAIMRADAENPASGRGRNSVRIVSKDEWADGVYILDLNHMPVGCGTEADCHISAIVLIFPWPAFWTTVKNGWPSGGEIDIIEGTNSLPTRNSTAWNATNPNSPLDSWSSGQNVASLHIEGTCLLQDNYQLGTLTSNTCQATINGNTGCGVSMGNNVTYGVDSFGSGFNTVGGYFAMWRDFANSGGAYLWYWPRGSSHLPPDVSDPNTQTTNVAGWGEPSANLSIPKCKSDFSNHVIVFNLAFCGDYANPTFNAAGCPGTCQTFVMNNPTAFTEAFWSIRSLRIYTASGQPASSSGLSKGAIAGIAVGVVVGVLIILGLGWWFWRRRRNQRNRSPPTPSSEEDLPKPYALVPGTPRSGNRSNGPSVPNTPSPQSQSGAFVPHLPTDDPIDPEPVTNKSGFFTRNKSAIEGKRMIGINVIPKNPKGNVQWNGYAREGKTFLAPGRSATSYLAGETPVHRSGKNTPMDSGSEYDMESRRGSVVIEPTANSRKPSAVLTGLGVSAGLESGNASAAGSRRGSSINLAETRVKGNEPNFVKLAKENKRSKLTGGSSGWAA